MHFNVADAFAHVAQAIEARREREQVEWVFGLTGGELDDDPLKWTDEDGRERAWAYHYDGVPEWCEREDFPDRYANGVDYFTLVEIGCSYGSGAPETIRFDGKLYVRVHQYVHSGETDCPRGPCGEGQETVEEELCYLCEAERGEAHGCIYVGDGCESVYCHIEISCKGCSMTAAECTPDALMCDCAGDMCAECGDPLSENHDGCR
jgi:hypothetical protein